MLLQNVACKLGQMLVTACPKQETAFIEPVGTISYKEMWDLVNAKLLELNDKQAEIYLPDTVCKIYCKDDVERLLALDETNKIVFDSERMDCDDFASALYGLFAGIVWTVVHAFNWFVDENKVVWFIEPQTDQISQTIADWQGLDVRFFLGR